MFKLIKTLLVLFSITYIPVYVKTETIKIGMLYSASGIYSKFGQTVPIIGNMWRDHINNNSMKDIGKQVEILYEDVQSNSQITVTKTKYLLSQNISVLFAPEGVLAGVAGIEAEKAGIPVVAGMVGSSDVFVCKTPLLPPCTRPDGSKRFKDVIGVMTPGQDYFRSFFPIVKRRGYKTASIMYYNDGAHIDACLGSRVYAEDYNVDIIYTKAINKGNTSYEDNQLKDSLVEIQNVNADILITCNRYACDKTLNILHEINYMPKAMGTFECASYINDLKKTIGDKAKYIITPLQWDQRLKGYEYTDPVDRPFGNMFVKTHNKSSPLDMYNKYNLQSGGIELSSLTPSALASLYVVEYAIYKCNCNDVKEIAYYMHQVYMPSFFGIIANNLIGLNPVKNMAMIQIDNDYNMQIISPDTSATMDPILPIPTWDERIYVQTMFSTTVEIVVLILVLLADILGILLIAFVIYHRKNKAIKSTSYEFTIMLLIGYILSCSAPLTWLLENTSDSCNARIPIFIIGFSLLLGPLISKNWRIAYIFNNKSLNIKHINNWDVLKHLCVVISPLLLILILWSSVYPLEVFIYTSDPLRPKYSYSDCIASNYVFGYISIALIFIVFIYATYISYRVKNAYKEFNDAESISKSISYCTFLLSIIIIIQLSLSNDNRVTKFIIRSFGIVIINMTIIYFMYSNKIYTILSTRNNSVSSTKLQTDVRASISGHPPQPSPVKKTIEPKLSDKTSSSLPKNVNTHNIRVEHNRVVLPSIVNEYI